MDQLNVGDLVFAVVQLFKNLNEPVTDEGVKAELPSVDIKDIRASLQRLHYQGRINGAPIATDPNLMNKE